MEVKRTSEESPLEEFEDGKRLWLKVEDIDDDLYQQHYTSTEFNCDIKILTTEQYVPAFLQKLCMESSSRYFQLYFESACLLLNYVLKLI